VLLLWPCFAALVGAAILCHAVRFKGLLLNHPENIPALAARRGIVSTEAMVAVGACFLLIALVVTTMRDKKPRFRLDPPGASPTPSATATPLPPATPATAGDIQALFIQGRAESPLIVPAEATNNDFAQPPVYREIREAELGRIYASAPKKNRRSLTRVAALGGFRSPEEMAASFGYPSVDEMLWNWEQAIATGPQFQVDTFGTNARPIYPVESPLLLESGPVTHSLP